MVSFVAFFCKIDLESENESHIFGTRFVLGGLHNDVRNCPDGRRYVHGRKNRKGV